VTFTGGYGGMVALWRAGEADWSWSATRTPALGVSGRSLYRFKTHRVASDLVIHGICYAAGGTR
jgi:hypothetical protein